MKRMMTIRLLAYEIGGKFGYDSKAQNYANLELEPKPLVPKVKTNKNKMLKKTYQTSK